MARRTVYNNIVTDEKLMKVNPKNIELTNDFLDYLASVDRSPKTIYQYSNDLNIFFVWNLENNENKFFVDLKKRDIVRFQKFVMYEYCWSPARVKRVKSVLSSLSNYIENFLDDEFEDFRPIIRKVESPVNEKVREKTVMSDEDVHKLLDTLTEEGKYEQACAVAIATYSGMRKSELLQMRINYFDDNHIIMDGAMYQTEEIRTKGRGKQGKRMKKYVLIAAKPYIDRWLEERKRLGVKIWDLFVTRDANKKWQKRKSIDHWTNYFSEIIGTDFYWHSLRHYLASKFDSMNIPAEVTREFNGWANVSMVSYYNDNEVSDTFGKYFTKDGIVKQDKGSLG